jgi:hypothetical protein
MLCRAAAINLEGDDFDGPPLFISGEEIARDPKKRRRIMPLKNLAHCLQKTLGDKTMRRAFLK